jgi:hypothetical protein
MEQIRRRWVDEAELASDRRSKARRRPAVDDGTDQWLAVDDGASQARIEVEGADPVEVDGGASGSADGSLPVRIGRCAEEGGDGDTKSSRRRLRVAAPCVARD